MKCRCVRVCVSIRQCVCVRVQEGTVSRRSPAHRIASLGTPMRRGRSVESPTSGRSPRSSVAPNSRATTSARWASVGSSQSPFTFAEGAQSSRKPGLCVYTCTRTLALKHAILFASTLLSILAALGGWVNRSRPPVPYVCACPLMQCGPAFSSACTGGSSCRSVHRVALHEARV